VEKTEIFAWIYTLRRKKDRYQEESAGGHREGSTLGVSNLWVGVVWDLFLEGEMISSKLFVFGKRYGTLHVGKVFHINWTYQVRRMFTSFADIQKGR